jgi:serine/threonine-protein kinase RsbW
VITDAENSRCISIRRGIPATFQAIDQFCNEVQALLTFHKLNDEVFRVHLLLREALSNAIQHGCQDNPALQIECELCLEPSRIVLGVRDPGSGFNWREQEQAAGNIEAESGRGLKILKRYASQVVWNEAGNAVIITLMLKKKEEETNDGEPKPSVPFSR